MSCISTLCGSQQLADDEYLEEPYHDKQHTMIRNHRHKTDPHIARIHIVSPTAGELFYLCCLLLTCPARNYRNLRIIDGRTFSTFHEAATYCGLFSTQDEGMYTMQEAILSLAAPPQLRFLFSHLILKGYPARPLWDQFEHHLTYDWTVIAPSHEIGYDRALQEIAHFLEESGRSLADYGLPQPVLRSPKVSSELQIFGDRQYELQETADTMVHAMDEDQ